jgi:hypothetical protein
MKATGAHIGVIGHITIEELQRLLTTTDMANGFGNRFLCLCVRRARLLPDGGALGEVDFQPLLAHLREVCSKAKDIERMQRDEEATAAWRAVYPALSEGKPGLVGALLARAEAQVLRLSMLYALLEGTAIIGAGHLYAALAVWEYCEASVAYIFGSALGDPTADTLLTALEASQPEGLSRKAILEETFQRNVRADELDRVLRMLLARKCITVQELPPESGRGRPKHIVQLAHDELNELNHEGYLSAAKDAVKSMALSSHMVAQDNELNPGGPREVFEV